MNDLFIALGCVALGIALMVVFQQVDQRAQDRHIAACFFVDGPHRPPWWLRLKWRRARRQLRARLVRR